MGIPNKKISLMGWWAAIGLGIAACAIWFPALAGSPQPDAAAPKVTITVKNTVFEPKDVTVAPGTTVEWVDDGGRHSVEADDGSFKSPTLIAGQKFEHKFDTPGKYPYFCGFHGSKGGHLMSGTITVK